jgi:hypothetical protein
MKDIPAFPVSGDWSQIKDKGMTLLDYFAAKAMQALIQFENQALPYESRNTKDFDDRVSYQAYRYAKAMMKERKL